MPCRCGVQVCFAVLCRAVAWSIISLSRIAIAVPSGEQGSGAIAVPSGAGEAVPLHGQLLFCPGSPLLCQALRAKRCRCSVEQSIGMLCRCEISATLRFASALIWN